MAPEKKRLLLQEEISKAELTMHRVLIIAGAIIYPLWYFYHKRTMDVMVETIWPRLVFSTVSLGFVFLSYVNSYTEKHFRWIFSVLTFSMIAHFTWLLEVSGYNANYLPGFVVLSTALFMVQHNTIGLFGYAGVLFLLLYRVSQHTGLKYSIFVMGIMTLLCISYLAMKLRHRTLANLDRQRTKFKMFIETAPVGFVLHDPQGRIVEYNGWALKHLGVTEEQFLGKHPYDPQWNVVNEEGVEISGDQHAASIALKERRVVSNQVMGVYNPETKARTWIQANANPIIGSDGGTQGVLVSFADITERKNAVDELIHARAQSAHTAKLASLGEMAGGVAHEINNPLAVILARAERGLSLIKREADSQSIADCFEAIAKMALRVTKIVKGLRTVSRDSAADPMSPSKVTDIIDETLSLCKEKFRNNGVDLVIDEIPSHAVVFGRWVQLSQVVLNLLNNAFDAVTPLDKKQVRIEFKDMGDRFELAVSDSGSGVPAEVRDKIFQPFFTTKEVGKGTGLGLSICTSIVTDHGGQFYLDKNNPSRFVMILPRYKGEQKAA